YDLVETIIREINSITRFVFIPMLTRNDNRGDGNKLDYSRAKAGSKNKNLVRFLGTCVKENKRDIREIKKYYENYNIEIVFYREAEYFNHRERASYFEGIDGELLSGSVIVVDPDNGLEVKNSNHKHLLFREVEGLYQKMDKSSILVLFQFFPRVHRNTYLSRRSKELRENTGDLPVYIHDNDVVFFVLTKNHKLKEKLSKIILEYRDSYPELITGNQ
ncbi:MAG: hypothetical protein V3T58_07955, partial [Candidatus Hydrothermarchaeales archaeon]